MPVTEGEWKVDGTTVYALNAQGTNRFFAGVVHGETDTGECTPAEELEANAHMLAASKEMYEALKAIIEECPNPKLPYGTKVVEIARKALLKAEGKGE